MSSGRRCEGVLTVLLLAAVVGLWAVIFHFRDQRYPGSAVPHQVGAAIFFCAHFVAVAEIALNFGCYGYVCGRGCYSPRPGLLNWRGGGRRRGGSASTVGALSAAVAGFQPKDLAPLGVGGVITGQVVSPEEPGGVGLITVEAFLLGSKAGTASSAATAPDGQYQIVGLFPGSYKVAFTAPGFNTVWYPGTPSEASATSGRGSGPDHGEQHKRLNITGKPATITGQVVTGKRLRRRLKSG